MSGDEGQFCARNIWIDQLGDEAKVFCDFFAGKVEDVVVIFLDSERGV